MPRNKDRGGVTAIINNPDKQDSFTDDKGTDHDLADDTGTASLVEAWGISDAQETAVEQLVKDTSGGTKDEVFGLAKVYAEAELGKRTMERVVLSGHSIGNEIFGQGAWMNFEVLMKLKDIFPIAAGGVKHVMLSACSSGYEATMAKFQEAFPNVKTVWGYAGVCPTGSGARSDMKDWEGKTDDKTEETVKPPGHGVGTWSEKEGYKGGEAMTYAEALADVDGMETEFQDYLAGKKEVASSSSGPMYTYYRSLQRLLGKPELVGSDRTKWTARMKVAVRLRFWPDIRGKFGTTFSSRLQKGYDAIGRKMPDFSKITRANALAEVAAFESAASSDAADALGLLQGFRDLDEKTIDGGWL